MEASNSPSSADPGDQLAALISIRDRLSTALDTADKPSDIAALSGRLVDVLDRIAAIKPTTKSKVDEIAEQRARRRAPTAG